MTHFCHFFSHSILDSKKYNDIPEYINEQLIEITIKIKQLKIIIFAPTYTTSINTAICILKENKLQLN